MAPRNSQEPNARDTMLVCLPCQPRPARCRQRLFHERGGVHEHLHVPFSARRREEGAGDALQLGLDDLVIILPRA